MPARFTAEQRPGRGSGFLRILNRFLLFLIVMLGLVFLGISFIPEFKRQRVAKAEIRRLEIEVASQETILKRQRQELGLLKSDPEYLEIIARDKMDLMKEGETIFRIDTPPSGSNPSLPFLPSLAAPAPPSKP